MSAVTFVTVLKMSGMSSTACTSTIASIGIPTASSGAVDVNIPALGVPGDTKLSSRSEPPYAAMVSGVSSTPQTYARKNNFTIPVTVRLALNTATLSGITNAVTEAGNRSLAPPSSRAGSEASDERVLMATACTGAAAFAKRRRPTFPNAIAAGYSAIVKTMQSTVAVNTNDTSERVAENPLRTAIEYESAKTASGSA